MKRSTRIALAGAALSAALGVAAPSAAHAQTVVAERARGVVSVGFGAPGFTIGAFVPFGYAGGITFLNGYGYGFYCDDGFVPVRRLGAQWVIAGAPIYLSAPSPYVYSYVGPRSDGYHGRYYAPRYNGRAYTRYDRRQDGWNGRNGSGRSDQRRDGRDGRQSNGQQGDGRNRSWNR